MNLKSKTNSTWKQTNIKTPKYGSLEVENGEQLNKS